MPRPRPQKAFLKLVFAPGECAQVDWGSYGSVAVGNTRRRLSFFVMVLCHCRMMYVECTVSQTMEHFLGCHQRAFEFFGGVPQKIMVDYVPRNIIRHYGLGNTTEKRKSPDMRADPVFNLLAQCGLGVGVTAGPQDGDKDLGLMYLTGFSVNHVCRLPGVVDEHFLASPMFMAHDDIQPGSPCSRIGDRNEMESAAGIKWNGWPEWNGIDGRDRPEYAITSGNVLPKANMTLEMGL